MLKLRSAKRKCDSIRYSRGTMAMKSGISLNLGETIGIIGGLIGILGGFYSLSVKYYQIDLNDKAINDVKEEIKSLKQQIGNSFGVYSNIVNTFPDQNSLISTRQEVDNFFEKIEFAISNGNINSLREFYSASYAGVDDQINKWKNYAGEDVNFSVTSIRKNAIGGIVINVWATISSRSGWSFECVLEKKSRGWLISG